MTDTHCTRSKWTVLDAGLEVEVKDPPKGMIPPGTQMVKPKADPQPSKVSPFFSLTNRSIDIHENTSIQICACFYQFVSYLNQILD